MFPLRIVVPEPSWFKFSFAFESLVTLAESKKTPLWLKLMLPLPSPNLIEGTDRDTFASPPPGVPISNIAEDPF